MDIDRNSLQRQRFSHSLIAFHKYLDQVDWTVQAPGCVLIRDYDGLPHSAPFDVDLACPTEETAAVAEIFESAAQIHGLISIIRQHAGGLICALFDPAQAAELRTWAYYEVFNRIRVTSEQTVDAREIGFKSSRVGLPRPTSPWKFFFEFLQGVRRDRLDPVRTSLCTLLTNDPLNAAIAKEILGLTADEITDALNPITDVSRLRTRAQIIPHGGTNTLRPPVWRKRARDYLFPRLYFLPIGNPALYTIHGPDGVGKTTACQIVGAIFDQYPIGFANEHHITGWKKVIPPSPVKIETSAARTERPRIRRLISAVYRFSPVIVRKTWYTVSGYHRYARNVMTLVYNHYATGRIVLLDRYVYDMWTKARVTGVNQNLLAGLGSIICLALRRPRLAILLTDQPETIRKRKQELSEQEIALYFKKMIHLLTLCRVPRQTIEVSGKSPEEVASLIVSQILNDLGDETINLVRDFVHRESKAP